MPKQRGVSGRGTREGPAARAGDPAEPASRRPRAKGADGAPVRSDLREELRRFVSRHPEGWGHEDWLQLLDRLRASGHEIHDPDAVGSMLERERLSLALRGFKGVGPQRIRALADGYGSVWNLRRADAGEVADSARIPRLLAEQIQARLQQHA